ncbi:MAG: NUDIX domain-containing protein [Candidatus Micrarchaeota archaeon]
MAHSLTKPQVAKILREYGHLPRFGDGRIDFTGSPRAPIIACFVEYKGKILLLKRSKNVSTHENRWNNISGYIDQERPLGYFVRNELREEAGIRGGNIARLRFGKRYEFYDRETKCTYDIHPVLVKLKRKQKVSLNDEHTARVWAGIGRIREYGVIPSTITSLKRVLPGE